MDYMIKCRVCKRDVISSAALRPPTYLNPDVYNNPKCPYCKDPYITEERRIWDEKYKYELAQRAAQEKYNKQFCKKCGGKLTVREYTTLNPYGYPCTRRDTVCYNCGSVV